MSVVGVEEFKNQLGRYLRRVKHGEEFVLTEQGKPIALIRPVQAAAPAMGLDARLAKLAAQGLVTLPTRKPLKMVRKVQVSGRPISRTVLEDRR